MRGRPLGSPNRAPHKPHVKSPPGPHRGAPPDRIARVRALLAIVDPLNVLGDSAVLLLGRIVGVRAGQIGPILRGERTISEGRVAGWEAAVSKARENCG